MTTQYVCPLCDEVVVVTDIQDAVAMVERGATVDRAYRRWCESTEAVLRDHMVFRHTTAVVLGRGCR